MADVLLSALVNTILENLSSLFLEEIGNAGALKTELENLRSTLSTIQAVLQDAEEKQSKSEAIKNWLGKLKDAAYSLEDVLDEFKREAMRRSLHNDAISQVSTFFSHQNPLLFRLNMARKFKNVREKLDAIAEQKTKFHLTERVGDVEIQRNEERHTSSLVEESEIHGRANEKDMIVTMLLNNSSHYDDLSVYAIWGMGGLGKTTVAQLVYNDERVEKAFDLRVWVCVSDDFDIKRLTKAIVESVEGSACNLQELDPLQRRLEEKLAGKQFLLVLDDVWNEDRDKWDGLKQALRLGVKGSTVIVTTRVEKIALMMATINPVCRLGYLSDDDSWSLFKQRAFVMGRNEDNARLGTIGREIAKKCGGVPLAIKAIASILSSTSQESEWLRVKDSKIWDLKDEGNKILAVLMLSYEHLPPYLKQCFSFCSIFPKDSVMSKQELIQLWMANGFIPSSGSMGLHEMGCEIFNELTWRSFFQEMKEDIDGNITCKMHDLIHDVATSIMKHECYAIEPDKSSTIPETARHLFVVGGRSSSKTIDDISKLQSLRSFIFCSDWDDLSYRSNFTNQKYLKVLSFPGRHVIKGYYLLKHLRYLNLSFSRIERLPESTGDLYSLQTLKLRYCSMLRMLPKGMKNLKNLHYLDIRGCTGLTRMPIGLANLSCLRELSIFIVGMDKGLGIDELKELALEGELSIVALDNVKSSAEAKKANLLGKPNLRSLTFTWQVNSKENSQHDNAEDVLNGLRPHPSLKKLCINNYQGLRFPYWMMDLLLPNLVEMSLQNCERCNQLPPLGKLRFLKNLGISGMGALKSIDSSFYGDGEGSFSSLETLDIRDAQCLEEWTAVNGRDIFPLLSSLTIFRCPKLSKLQWSSFPSLKMLEICGALCLEEWTEVNGRDNFPLLSSLTIRHCPQLIKVPMLKSLKQLDIEEIGVTSLDGLLQNQKQLEMLSICSRSLKSLSNLLDNLSALKCLDLRCSELERLPEGLQNLSTLEYLQLSYCDSLVTLPENALRGLSSLSSLWFQHCKKFASLSEGVRYLTSLTELLINQCPKLTSLPESIQHLSSLRSLEILSREGFSSLPDEIEHLTLLSKLRIASPNLRSLPRGIRSLTALESLSVEGCPDLTKRYKKERGEDWPNIAHIPSIRIRTYQESSGSHGLIRYISGVGDLTYGRTWADMGGENFKSSAVFVSTNQRSNLIKP